MYQYIAASRVLLRASYLLQASSEMIKGELETLQKMHRGILQWKDVEIYCTMRLLRSGVIHQVILNWFESDQLMCSVEHETLDYII